MKTKIILLVTLISVVFLILSLNVGAGSLEPASSPAPTMYTLEEIYTRIKQLAPEDWKTFPLESQVTNASAIHMTIEGQNQGNIPGDCQAQGKEDTIRCVGWEHRVYVPYNIDSGSLTDVDKHEPITVIKYIDKSTVPLYRAMCTNERLTEIFIRFYRTRNNQAEEQYFTIRLADCYIVEMREITPNLESVSFLYQRIEWMYDGDPPFEQQPYQPR